ncbi:MAG: bifunctional metallophosphatase/5'-nucleotidase [Actinomycetia bacterium]|nr:bifunctional metallophosphatase/5'-nucleotidase [Actinomycetes bacterium]
MKYLRLVGVLIAVMAMTVSAVPALAGTNDDVGLFDPGQGRWHLMEVDGSTTSFYFGDPGDSPFMGDWDGNGIDTPGLFRMSDGFVYLRNTNTQGIADTTFFFGNPGDMPVVGDFNGNGFDTVSVYRPSNQTFYIINELGVDGGGLGAADFDFVFGLDGDMPIAGDWNGDGTDTIGVFRPSTGETLQRNTNSAGPADTTLLFGDAGDAPFYGDWDGHGTDTPGVFRSPEAKMYLRNENTTGGADESFFFGTGGWTPLAGRRAPLPPIQFQILSINDFHGNIATTSGAFGGVGRADYLAANVAAAEAGLANSVVVSAGDLIGASPLISALFHDEPTIEAMNLIGLDINGVGNHEFDEGAKELIRMQEGGPHPVDGDIDGDPFNGAEFEFLAANVEVTATGKTIFPAYTIKEYEGVKVAFFGMTLEGTPSIVTPAGVAGLTFNDEVDSVNALIPGLQAQGIEAFVVLMHQGGFASEGGGDGDGCGTLSGPLYDIVVGLDEAVDVVIGGHNNQRFACMDVEGKAVTMAYHSGRMFTDIDATLDRDTGELTVSAIDNVPNAQDGVTPDASVTALIDKYDKLSAPLANQIVGSVTVDLTEDETLAGESALGDVIADAQLASTSSAATGNAVAAFMNPGGIRADLMFAPSGTEAPGEVTYAEAFTTQPFGNSLVTMTLTGTQIDTLLEQQWVGQTGRRILQVSDGFTYTWDAAMADGSKIDASTIMIGGVMVEPGTGYRITVNSFLASGGDNFTVLVDGTDRLGGEIDLDALVTYFGDNSPVPPGPQDRITVVNLP